MMVLRFSPVSSGLFSFRMSNTRSAASKALFETSAYLLHKTSHPVEFQHHHKIMLTVHLYCAYCPQRQCALCSC